MTLRVVHGKRDAAFGRIEEAPFLVRRASVKRFLPRYRLPARRPPRRQVALRVAAERNARPPSAQPPQNRRQGRCLRLESPGRDLKRLRLATIAEHEGGGPEHPPE